MKVFELHFNAKQNDKVFESFVLDNLYIAGELKKALPQSKNFLRKISALLMEEHYKEGFQNALRKTNEFLNQETKNGDIDWLGNLSLAALNLENFILNFTKVGDIKILLIREGEILDIGENLEFQDQDAHPSKVFSNTASGKLSAKDKILVLTREIFANLAVNKEILDQFKAVANEKDFKKIPKTNKQLFSELSGLCLFLIMEDSQTRPIKLPRTFKTLVLVIALGLLLLISYFIFST